MESGAGLRTEESRACSTPTGSLNVSFSTTERDRRSDDVVHVGSMTGAHAPEEEETKAEHFSWTAFISRRHGRKEVQEQRSSSLSSSSSASSPISACTFAMSIEKRGSTRGTSSDPRSSGRREEADKQAERRSEEAEEEGEPADEQTERPSSSSEEDEAEATGSRSGSSPSSMVGREEHAAGGFPSRESALTREGLTDGRVQKEAGGAFMPSN